MLKEKIINQIKNKLVSQKRVAWAYLYGSFVTEEKFEDIDLAVYLDPVYLKKCPSLLKEEQTLASDLEKALSPRLEIDLKILNRAPVHFQYQVLRNGKLIYFRDPSEVVRYEGDTISSYLDYKPTIQFFEKALLERIEKW